MLQVMVIYEVKTTQITSGADQRQAIDLPKTGQKLGLRCTLGRLRRQDDGDRQGSTGKNGRHIADNSQTRPPGIKALYTQGSSDNIVNHLGRLDQGIDVPSEPYRQDRLAMKFRMLLDVQVPSEMSAV